MSDNFWILRPDTRHLEDFDAEADHYIVPFPGHESANGLASCRPPALPAEVLCEGDFEALNVTDVPVSIPGWSILSRRALDVLTTVGPLPEHEAIPLSVIDATVPPDDRLDVTGALRRDILRHDFFGLHLREQAHVFDFQCSVYVPNALNPERVRRVQKLVLRPFPGAVPPIFRLAAKPAEILASDEARRALERAGIRGARFLPLSEVFC